MSTSNFFLLYASCSPSPPWRDEGIWVMKGNPGSEVCCGNSSFSWDLEKQSGRRKAAMLITIPPTLHLASDNGFQGKNIRRNLWRDSICNFITFCFFEASSITQRNQASPVLNLSLEHSHSKCIYETEPIYLGTSLGKVVPLSLHSVNLWMGGRY